MLKNNKLLGVPTDILIQQKFIKKTFTLFTLKTTANIVANKILLILIINTTNYIHILIFTTLFS